MLMENYGFWIGENHPGPSCVGPGGALYLRSKRMGTRMAHSCRPMTAGIGLNRLSRCRAWTAASSRLASPEDLATRT